jgi:hypothetical protein
VGVDARLDEVKLEIEGGRGRGAPHSAPEERAGHPREDAGHHRRTPRDPAHPGPLAYSVGEETLEGALGTLDSALEGLEVGDTVDEALLGRLGEVRSALEDVLERSERALEGAAQEALGEGEGEDTTASP